LQTGIEPNNAHEAPRTPGAGEAQAALAHYGCRTEIAYVGWIRQYVHFHRLTFRPSAVTTKSTHFFPTSPRIGMCPPARKIKPWPHCSSSISTSSVRHPGCVRAGLGALAQDHEQILRVHVAHEQADRRHDYVIHERLDDRPERRTDDDTDGHVHDITADGEFPELFQYGSSMCT
jgi:hypothetical protein